MRPIDGGCCLSAPYQFEGFQLDVARYELRRNGHVLRLEKIPMELLILLISRHGELISREEIIAKLWGQDVFIETEHGINTAVRKIRQTLGDDPEQPRFVQTVVGKGYRFVAPVRTDAGDVPQTSRYSNDVATAEAKEAPRADAVTQHSGARPAAETPVSSPAITRGRYRAWGVLALVLILGGVGAANRWRVRPFAPGTVPRIESLAVIPLTNLSHDPEQEYFADGMTEALITDLAQIRALRVISRTSVMHYKGTDKTLPEIARELNVDAVIEGAVQRSGNRVRVTAQLIHGESDVHLWARTYERDSQDVLLMQTELAQAIAGEVKARLTAQERQQLASARPVKTDAYNAYLLGNFHAAKRTPESIAKAIEYFQQAIRIDPDYPQAYTGLVNTYFEQEIWGGAGIGKKEDQIRANTLKAIGLDENLAEGHLLLARIHFYYDWDWERTEAEFKRAIELNANLPAVYDYYAFFLQAMGRQQEAIASSHRAVELDPLSPWYLSDEGRMFFRARQYESAVARYQRALELDPNDVPALTRMTDVYTVMGNYDEAQAYINKLRQVTGDNKAGSLQQLLLYAHTGKQREALLGLAARPRDGVLDHDVLGVASIYAALGDHDHAIAILEKAFETHSTLAFTFVDPRLDSVRADPRFQQLLHRAKIPS